MRIAICDDDHAILSALKRMAETHPDVETMLFSSAEGLLTACVQERFDLFFLDIMLGSANGIAVAEMVCSRQPEARVVFITAHILDFAEKIFAGVRPYGYIGKPLDSTKVDYYIRRAAREDARAERSLTVSRRGVEYSLPMSGIRCIESRGRQAFIRCGDETVDVYERLDALEQQLDERFVRCHQSFIVNLDYVNAMEGDSFTVADIDKSMSIRISRNRLRDARHRYFEYKGRSVL